MSRTSPSDIRSLLAELGIRPRKAWGQHFLCDRNALRRIVDAAELAEGEAVLEIGPGLGALTEALLARGHSVVAVERDPHLVDSLRAWAAPGLEIVHADFLRYDLEEALTKGVESVVSNLPYCITTPVLERLLPERRIRRMVLTVQREVADRLRAAPGSREYGSLSVFAQHHTVVRSLFTLSPRLFYPPPEVESAVVRMDRRQSGMSEGEERCLRDIVRAAFGGRRKTLRNSLQTLVSRERAEALLAEVGVDPQRRAETLSVDTFEELARRLAATS
ncbi:MAG: ribosomal RNA small subunit methyltransferase A [Fimbriimonadales bacterium]